LKELNNMKSKISITVDKEVLKMIQDKINTGKFRNRSHVVEYGVKRLIEEEDVEEEK